MTEPTCPKCSADMEEGFVLDHTYGTRMPAEWVEGKPVRSFWQGVKVPKGANHAVIASRCTRCGYLESYAPAV
jgi:predicted nucleic-acid-binding Zn-ribbon protein